MMPGSVIVASVGSGPQLPHTDVATHPEVLPPHDREVGGCHLSSFLCLSEDYQVAVQAGTALGGAGEARWDTVELHQGDMLLMVATRRHHGLPALPDSKDGLQGALFNLWTSDPRHKNHQANTTHLDATTRKGDDTAINGVACYLPDRINHLFKCRPPPPSDIMQRGDRRLHWLPIAVDDTSRHEASYIHCTLGGTASPNQLSSWWPLGGSEKWETLYAASQEIDFDAELRKAATVSFKDTAGNDRQSLFFWVQMVKHRCSWRATKTGRQNPLVPLCVGSACGTVLCALLPLAQQVR